MGTKTTSTSRLDCGKIWCDIGLHPLMPGTYETLWGIDVMARLTKLDPAS